jgi:P4 family phage/plasmid primase-like protien
MATMEEYTRRYKDYICFSTKISATHNTKGELKKTCRFPKDWTNFEESKIKDKHNGLAIITGEKSGVFVIDYDTEDNFIKDSKTYPELTNHYVKTHKGFHCYFQWTPTVQSTIGSTSVKKHNIDFQGDKKCIFAPPTTYEDEKRNTYTYELQNDKPLKEMSEELREYMIATYLQTKTASPTKGQEKKKKKNINEQALNEVLNEMFHLNCEWKIKGNENDGVRLTPDCKKCLVEVEHTHSESSHSWLYINTDVAFLKCFSHDKRKLKEKEHPQLKRVRNLLGIKNKNEKKVIPDNYQKIELTPEDIEFMKDKTTTTHDDVSAIFHHFFHHRYVCASETPRPVWYSYNKGIWEKMEGMSTLRKEFISGLLPYYYTYYDMCLEIGDEEHLSYASIVSEIVVKLKTTGYTDSLMRQVIHYFKYNNFVEELDKYRYLLCFGEDVYDLKTNEWRKTTKDDMCSKKCGLTKDEVSDKYINDLLEVLEDIHPDPERRQFFINSLSDLLYGKNTKELFHIWTGTGRNGKGVVSDIIKLSFGDYFCSPSVSLITQKRISSNSADPQLATTRGARIVMFSEPEENSRLNNSIIKQLTGGDDLMTRNLFESPFTFTPHFTPIIQCNTFQLQDIKDDSIPERLLFMKFKTSFVDNPTMDWQRLKDETLKDEENMQRLKGAMMYLLLKTWEDLSPDHRFKQPQSVIDDKTEFLDENNNVKQFVDERIEFTKEKKDFLSAKDLLAMYRDFMDDRNERTGKLTLAGFITRIRKYMGEYKERHQPYDDNGVKKEYRRVFLYCKEQEDVIEA